MSAKQIDYDIFCTVIDNFGDIGTCWRLAMHLQRYHSKKVRLWVDDLTALATLVPNTCLNSSQQYLNHISVCHWSNPLVFEDVAPVCIEAFGCELPDNYRKALINQHGLCINLEYFSCESWVLGCHQLRSFQSDGLRKYFFFPGIRVGTGGLLIEADYETERKAFQLSEQQAWFDRWKLNRKHQNSLRISLFGYENTAIIDLLTQSSQYPTPVEFYCPISKICHSIQEAYPNWEIKVDNSYTLGNASIHFIPFLPQAEYDKLLWSCDLNFVRGEESLIRGLLAAKPLVWHIYPTEDGAHWQKLNDFIQLSSMNDALAELTNNWNAQQHLPSIPSCLALLPQLTQEAKQLQQSILTLGSLSTNLINLIESIQASD